MTEDCRCVFELEDEGRYEEALAVLCKLPAELQRHGRMIIARGDCLYELGKDVEALDAYLDYLRHFPGGKATNFALFNAAICLKNLDLQQEAHDLLVKVAPDHPDLVKELDHSEQMFEKQRQARALLAAAWTPNLAASRPGETLVQE